MTFPVKENILIPKGREVFMGFFRVLIYLDACACLDLCEIGMTFLNSGKDQYLKTL